MKLTPALIVAILLGVVLCIGLVYLDIQLSGATREITALKAATAASETHMAAVQVSLDAFKSDLKQYDAVIGSQGTLQLLAKGLQSGEMDLSLKSLRIVAKGKSLVTLGATPDVGGLVQVGSSDGSSFAEISSMAGKSRIGLKATTTGDAGQAVHIATYGAEGYYLQKGPSDDPATKTDSAGLQILDDGADFLLAQAGGGNVSMGTSAGDERAKLSIWSDGNPKKVIYLSLGPKDVSPFVSVSGAHTGFSLTLLPDRLSLAGRDGTVVLAAAEDIDGGYVFVNDKSGARRAIMTAGSEGHGSISVLGSDNRSNTLYPEYNIQRAGSNQK